MDRRAFFKTGVAAAAAGAAVSLPTRSTLAADTPGVRGGAPAILQDFTAEDHRRRLTNIGICTQTDPHVHAQAPDHQLSARRSASTTWASIPAASRGSPGEYDEQELDRLKDAGNPVDPCDGRME